MLLSDNLTARISLILLAGSAALLVIIGVLAGLPPSISGQRVIQPPAPADAAAIVEAVEAAGPELRPKVVRAMNIGILRVAVAPAFPAPDGLTRAAAPGNPAYDAYSRRLDGRALRLDLLRGATVQRQVPIRLSVRLADGEAVVIQRRSPRFARELVARFALTMAAGALVVLLMLILAVRQTTRPVADLAAAVDRFGDRLDADELPLRGPREIRDLSRAFNGMKRRIRGLVDERTRVLAAVAHDMRTYLTRLRLRSEFIADETQRAKAVADLEEMSALLDDTLLFAREDGGHGGVEAVDVAAELRALVGLRQEMGEAVTLASADAALAEVSTLALRRMASNLIDNAVRYGGAAEVSVQAAGGWTCLLFCDRGPGLPEEALDRLTGPFERLEGSRNRATGGAGLGLAIVRALAEAQGGRLVLRNRPGGGLEAEVRLRSATGL